MMKKIIKTPFILLFVGLFFCLAQKVKAQTSQFSLVLNSGLYSFTGNRAVQNSIFIVNSSTGSGYTNDSYGSNAQISYGLSGNLKFVMPSKFIYGADLGYEVLRSKVNIISVFGTSGSASVVANGKSILSQDFINLFPFVGYQLTGKLINIDLIAGLDIAYCISAKEKATVNANGSAFNSSIDRKEKDFDYRPRLQVGVNYQKFGIYTGYSLGLINQKSQLIGTANNDARASYIRFGLLYRLN